MENLVLLDTNTLFDFLANKGIAKKVEKLLLQSRSAISIITFYELFNGVENSKHLEQRDELTSLCRVIDLTKPIAKRASSIYTDLKKKGKLIHHEDILIAATSIHWNYPILTLNQKHFNRIPGLVFYN